MSGYTFYDEEQFFDQFQKRRNREESPNNAMEGPAIRKLMREPKGKEILDLGCGDGQFGVELLEGGAEGYHGIDGSKRMIETATIRLQGYGSARLDCSDLTTIDLDENTYDLVVSRFVLHYLSDVTELFDKVHRTLKKDGHFLFSVMHPVITSSIESAKEGKRSNWIVDDYFKPGPRLEPWMNTEVTKYHRTIEQYITQLLEAGFHLQNLKEATPDPTAFRTKEEYERRLRIPLALIISVRK